MRSVSVFCAIAALALLAGSADAPAGEPLDSRLTQGVSVPRGDESGIVGLPTIRSIWGNAQEQIEELLVQVGAQGVVDLGRGWREGDPARVEEGFTSPDPALDWPAFDVRDDAPGSLPTQRQAIDAFFRQRPAFEWFAVDGRHVRIQPRDAHRRLGWLLGRQFRQPLTSDVGRERGWVLRADRVQEAVAAVVPEWKRWGIAIDFEGDQHAILVFTEKEASVANLGDFLRLWCAGKDGRSVFLRQRADENEVDDLKHVVTVRFVASNPNRTVLPLSGVVQGLGRESGTPAGYDTRIARFQDCAKELVRRFGLGKEAVIRSVLRSADVGGSSSPADLTILLLTLEPKVFGRYICERFWSMPGEVQLEVIGPLNWYLPDGDPAIDSFWRRAADANDATIKRVAKARLSGVSD